MGSVENKCIASGSIGVTPVILYLQPENSKKPVYQKNSIFSDNLLAFTLTHSNLVAHALEWQ